MIIKQGISLGLDLEVGPGPGYLGLEWLKHTKGTNLNGLDISDDMIAIARKNTVEYKLSDRDEYFKGDAQQMPFEDKHFDAVFTNSSLHEWAHPESILNEIERVIKPCGIYVISDLRRDMLTPVKWFLWLTVKPREMRPGLVSSLNAAYTFSEIQVLLTKTKLHGWNIRKNILGIVIIGRKPA